MDKLSLGFIENFAKVHPVYTAKIFEFIPNNELINVLQSLSYDDAANIIEKMSAKTAFDLISNFPEDIQAKILRNIEIYNLIAILKFADKAKLANLIKKLNFANRTKVEIQLKFSQDEVGTWMNLNVPQLKSDFTVLEAKKFLHDNYENTGFEELYIINNDNNFEAILPLDKLFFASENIKIGSIGQKTRFTISPRVKLQAAKNHIGFSRHDRLPVVSIQNKVLGVFSILDLKKGLSFSKGIDLSLEDDLPTTGYGIYGDTILSLLNIK